MHHKQAHSNMTLVEVPSEKGGKKIKIKQVELGRIRERAFQKDRPSFFTDSNDVTAAAK